MTTADHPFWRDGRDSCRKQVIELDDSSMSDAFIVRPAEESRQGVSCFPFQIGNGKRRSGLVVGAVRRRTGVETRPTVVAGRSADRNGNARSGQLGRNSTRIGRAADVHPGNDSSAGHGGGWFTRIHRRLGGVEWTR